MSYTSHPAQPRVRAQAVELVRRGWSARKVGRYLGFHHTAVMKWVRISLVRGYGAIPTRSSRPKHHPRELSRSLIEQIIAVRLEHGRSAEVVHHVLLERGMAVSLSSVKRTLDRALLTKKRSPWKRYHPPMDRPTVAKPGDLVQVDTIHLAIDGKTTLYVFTLVDVFSRFAYARAYTRVTATNGLAFLKRAQTIAPFLFDCVQSDHGPEWSTHFTDRVRLRHRHTRVRKPNDNAHIERFNRTIQEECLDKLRVDLAMINQALPAYLQYYNFERHHFGLKLKKPMQVVPSY